MKISFVIPCYNTTRAIREVLKEIELSMEKRNDDSYEIILVNDCSPNPDTIKILLEMVKEKDFITLVDLSKNSGQPNAILAGCMYATGDYIMTSDDDGQTQLDKLDEFIQAIESGYDVVCAKYTSRVQKSLFRRFGSFVNRKMADWLIERPKDVYMSTIFIAKRFVVEEMIQYDQPYAYISGLILRITQNVGNVEMEQRDRAVGESGYTLKKLMSLWLNGFTAFSIKPLRVADLIGGITAFVGVAVAVITIIRKLLDSSIQAGWSSMIAVLLITSGLHLLLLGFVGEYVGRCYMCINKTPQYVVRKVYQKQEGENVDEI